MGLNKIDTDFLKSHGQYPWSDIVVFDSIDSTSNWVKSQARHQLVCLSEQQTAGRGRHGHQWQSPNTENIYLSFSWQFDTQPPHLSLLSLWVGVIVAEALSSIGLSGHGVKWPNDIYWQQKKMGGVLLETSNLSSMLVIGIGINVNMQSETGIDQPWVSVNQAMGQMLDRNHILLTLLNLLYEGMSIFQSLSVEDIKKNWQKWDLIYGRKVSFLDGGDRVTGDALGIDESGQLKVNLETGGVKAFGTTISKVRW